jgi:peroxiredoxin/outer membrane lipoprotein-sorting protein
MQENGNTAFRFLSRAVCFVALLLGASSARAVLAGEGQAGASLTSEQLVGRMAEAFKGVQTLETAGKADVAERMGGKTRTGELAFELKLQRPNRLYYKVVQKSAGFLVVWDGSTGWISALDTGQYQKQEGLADLPHFLPRASAVLQVPGRPLSYVHDLLLPDPKAGILAGVTRAQVPSPQNSSTYSLVLPQRDGEVVTLSVGKEDFLIQAMLFDRTEVIRKQATAAGHTVPDDYKWTLAVTFTDTKVNQPIEQTAFTFSPPRGAELVTKFGPQPLTSKLAPDFTLNSLSGKPVTLSALRGGVVILDFWATWCPPCRAGLPHLEKLSQEFQGKGLTVLGVSSEEKATIETFLKDQKVTFTILLDPKGVGEAPYQVTAIPRTLIIDREGKVADDFTGLQEERTLRAALAKLGIK